MADEPVSKRAKITLYALGSNGQGQLGIGSKDDCNRPQKCLFSRLSPHHSTPDSNKDENNDDSNNSNLIDHLPLLDGEEITKLAAGGNHTLLLTSRGRVFATGLNDCRQCRTISSLSQNSTQRPEDVSNEGTLRSDGADSQIWRWIYGTDAQEDSDSIRITDIACTWTASLFVFNDQWIEVSGSGTKGELGLGKGLTQTDELRTCLDVKKLAFKDSAMPRTDERAKIESIRATMSHIVVLLSSGRIIGWGASRKGQLGEKLKEQTIVWSPTEIELPGSRMVSSFVVAGRDWTFVSSAKGLKARFLGDEKKLDLIKMWDTGAWSEEVDNIQELEAGWSSLAALMQNGRVKGFGRSEKGQLPPDGVGKENTRIAKVAAGSEHFVALLDDGKVVAWGWGEHGNCGEEVDEKKNVNNRYNVVFEPRGKASERSGVQERVVNVAAGCATTFFWMES